MHAFVAIFAGIVLLVGALYASVTWPALLRRVANDPRARESDGRRTTFYRVHRNLTAGALTIAALSAVSGLLVLVYLV